MNNDACMNRTGVKRCKERCLEEAAQLLRQIPEAQLGGLEESHLLLLVRLLMSVQLQVVNISTACRKVDQVSPAVVCFFTAQCSRQNGISLKLHICSADVATFGKGGPPVGL